LYHYFLHIYNVLVNKDDYKNRLTNRNDYTDRENVLKSIGIFVQQLHNE